MKKENKSHVKGLHGLTQDCYIMDEHQPETSFSKQGFFLSSKSSTEELDVTPTSRQIDKIH